MHQSSLWLGEQAWARWSMAGGQRWGLELDAVAPRGVWRGTPWLPIGFGGEHYRGLEVDAAAPHVTWRWTLLLLLGL